MIAYKFKLFKMVLRNQLHESQKNCIRNLGRNGNCKFGFPYLPHIESIFLKIKIQKDGNIIDHVMKIEMLSCIILHYYYYGEHI